MSWKSGILPWALCAALPAASAAEPSVRVRVIEQVGAVVLSGRRLQVQDRLVPEEKLHATVRHGEVHVAHLASTGTVRIRAAGGLAVNGEPYPGNLDLVPRPDGRMDVINELPLEPYVERAVAGEVFADWPRAALMAQAVVSRTYALHERARRGGESFHLEASVFSQRYRGQPVPERVRGAVARTRGEYLAFHGEPILAAFHSSAGGRTASSRETWGQELPYLRSVPSPDDEAPSYFWSFEISSKDLEVRLRSAGLEPGTVRGLEVLERSRSGRVVRLAAGEARLSGRQLRALLGAQAIRSTNFEARPAGDRVRFLGSGSGHGVGLSQWGARELALRGSSYREILAYYYPGCTLAGLPGSSVPAGRRR